MFVLLFYITFYLGGGGQRTTLGVDSLLSPCRVPEIKLRSSDSASSIQTHPAIIVLDFQFSTDPELNV